MATPKKPTTPKAGATDADTSADLAADLAADPATNDPSESGVVVNDPDVETELDDAARGRITNETTEAQQEVNDQIADLRDATGDDGGDAVLVPVPEVTEPVESQPATFDIAPLDPLDSEEAWKEQTRVPSGQASGDRQPGPTPPPLIPQTPDQRAAVYADAPATTVTETRDGRVQYGISPNSVIVEPDYAPPPVNPLSSQSEQQRRVLYEDLINHEADAFAADARRQFVNAAVAGRSVSITTDDGEDEADGARDDAEYEDDVPAALLPEDDDIATTGAPTEEDAGVT